MSTQPIRVGVIGAGGISRIHLQTLTSLPGLEVIAVADVMRSNAESRAEQFQIPWIFEDYHDLLALAEIDAVHICTFNQAHCAPTVAALRAGKHVLDVLGLCTIEIMPYKEDCQNNLWENHWECS